MPVPSTSKTGPSCEAALVPSQAPSLGGTASPCPLSQRCRTRGGLWERRLLPTRSNPALAQRLTKAGPACRGGHAFHLHTVGSSLASWSQERHLGAVLLLAAGSHLCRAVLAWGQSQAGPTPVGKGPNGPAGTPDWATTLTQAHASANHSSPRSALPARPVPQHS